MLNSEHLGQTMGPQQGPAPNAIRESTNRSVALSLSLDHLLRHSRIEPLIRKIFPDQRRYDRLVIPHVVAYIGRAHASRPHRIGNISVGGFCMSSDEHWTPGTEMPITLQREEWDGEESPERVSVPAIVTRCGLGEVGFSIVLTPDESLFSADTSWISKEEMERFLENLNKPKPPRPVLVNFPRERPLPLAERSERLLEIARLHSLSAASELWYTQDR